MSSYYSKIDTRMSVSFIVSAVIHLAVFLLLVWYGSLFAPQVAIQETYYVDVVNLPTSNPRSGSSAQKPGEAESVVIPVPVPAPASQMPLSPVSKPATKVITNLPKAPAPQESAETESAFNERMAKLERKSDARREEAVLEKLRSKVRTGNSKVGTPEAGGVGAGSRYADYIKSRLEDALKITSSYTTRNPEVAVRLTIAADGALVRMKIEHSSGDVTFELAVRRAIDLASEKFTAPPNHTVFENGFVFRPKSISDTHSR